VVRPANDFSACDDGLFCTGGDHCEGGECVTGTSEVCPTPAGGCAVAVCDEEADACDSPPVADGTPCDDGDPCTDLGTCQAGACSGAVPTDCTHLDEFCLVEGVCDPALGCVSEEIAVGSPCPAGPAEACSSAMGECTLGGGCLPVPIDQGLPCGALQTAPNECLAEVGICDSGVCSPQFINVGGACESGDPLNDCKTVEGTCAFGSCSATIVNDGQPCVGDGDDECNAPGTCQFGNCIQMAVNDGQPCTATSFGCQLPTGVCSQGLCQLDAKPNGTSCDLTQVAFESPDCIEASGQCIGGGCMPIAANEGGSCAHELAPCTAGKCTGGFCQADGLNDGIACETGIECTVGTCNAGGCMPTPIADGDPCDDHLSCTTGDTCLSAVCSPAQGPPIYYYEDFSDYPEGWDVDWYGWEFGPAKGGFGDPTIDATPSADNGLAAVMLGGPEESAAHGMRYFSSPPIDTSGAPGSVVFAFQRWLNGSASPEATYVVRVWDGAGWVTLWTSSTAIADTSWQLMSFDVTAYKNELMRVQFGFARTVPSAVPIGGWTIDDVIVSEGSCL
jgi:hypothetical protein